MASTSVLLLSGSPEELCMHNLSLRYTRDCLEALRGIDGFSFHVAVVQPDGMWRFSDPGKGLGLQLCKPIPRLAARDRLTSGNYDLAIPQLFCRSGMTEYRALLDHLKIPFIGNTADVMGITANKATTKQIVARVGVPVPSHRVMRAPDLERLTPPFIVKPNDSDNSFGVTLVRRRSELSDAFNAARKHSTCVLAEQYIPAGREVRCGIIDHNGSLTCLPLQEYPLNDQHSIRTTRDKLIISDAKDVDLASKYDSGAVSVPVNDRITTAVWKMAMRCHRALDCRDYSLFDFRIDPHGTPYFMEAGLYCSFAPKSILTLMTKEYGIDLETFFREMAAQAIRRHQQTPSYDTLRHKHRRLRAVHSELSKLEI